MAARSIWSKGSRFQSYKRCLHNDSTLNWARANPNEARTALEQPAFNHDNALAPAQSFEQYWEKRNWKLESQHAKHLVTHVLSHPLTLAHYIRMNSWSDNLKSRSQLHWCCVGARNESTLPLFYWRELLASLPHPISSMTLEFLGPEISPQLPHTVSHNKSTLKLKWSQQKLLHDVEFNPSWTGFVLFNPGLGHPNLAQGWKESLPLILQRRLPVLLTAHSKLDADRDTSVLQDLKLQIMYTKNPFASRITFKDPISIEDHWVSSNQWACWIDEQ